MSNIHYSSLDFADTVISNIYYKEQAPILNTMPRSIANRQDVLKLNISSRTKIREAAQLYEYIKREILLNLDEMANLTSEKTNKINKKIVELFSNKYTKNEFKNKLKELKTVNDEVSRFVIMYDQLSWFRDPNLLSTIRFHEKLNNVFLSKAEESLEYDISREKIENLVNNITINEKYLKSIIVITLFPILAYGAIYASLNYDFAYILNYQKAVSKAAEDIFFLNPSMKEIFFESEK
jgi:hypothetical protein